MEDGQVMQYLNQVIKEGKVDSYAEAVALLHSFGKNISENSLSEIYISGSRVGLGQQEKEIVATVIAIYCSIGEVNPYFEDLLLKPVNKSYKNPLIEKPSVYSKESMRTAVIQYCLLIGLANLVLAFRFFKQMGSAMDSAFGPGKKTTRQASPESLNFLNKFAVREVFDPYLHATLLSYSFGGVPDPKIVNAILVKCGVKQVDSRRIEKACDLVKSSDIPSLVKTEMANLEKTFKSKDSTDNE